MEHRRLSDKISVVVSIITLLTVISSMFFWFYKTSELPNKVEKHEERLDRLEKQIIENNTKTDLIYQGVLEIRSTLLRK